MRFCLMTSYIKYIHIFKCVDLNTVFGINYKINQICPVIRSLLGSKLSESRDAFSLHDENDIPVLMNFTTD